MYLTVIVRPLVPDFDIGHSVCILHTGTWTLVSGTDIILRQELKIIIGYIDE